MSDIALSAVTADGALDATDSIIITTIIVTIIVTLTIVAVIVRHRFTPCDRPQVLSLIPADVYDATHVDFML